MKRKAFTFIFTAATIAVMGLNFSMATGEIAFTASTLHVVFTGDGVPPNPLPECHGDCDDDSQCAGDLVCFQRYVILKNHD